MLLIILPNQLFPTEMIYSLMGKKINKVILIEESRYFTDYKYHKLKLMYHRVSMKKYEKELVDLKIKTQYIDFNKVTQSTYKLLNRDTTYYFDPIDHVLNKKLNKLLPDANRLDNLNFLMTPVEVKNNKKLFYKNNKYRHELFYKMQRKRLNILLNGDKPVGNKWSYDNENRLPLPRTIKIPPLPKTKKDKYYTEAKSYVNKHFSANYGSTDEWILPTTNKSAVRWLKTFLAKKLNSFGPYEDAADSRHHFLFHSVISPMMNIGILPDTQVISVANNYYKKNKSKIKLQSFEGFIRQVIGWRNYVYAIYLLEPNMYNQNFLKHKNKISDKYWTGNVGIEPIDSIIKKIVKYGYAHHIERLMYLGNWFLINQADPKEVHRIFMEWTIDAYDWVMVPNVMGMSQYADGGNMTNRMYFSSSNYIDKMSNYKRKASSSWWKIWDVVYYSFIAKHNKLLSKNYATSRQVAHWNNKSKNERREILELSGKYKLL